MIAQRDALLRLLRDDDVATLGLVKTQLAQAGIAALPELRALLKAADPVAARQLREVIGDVEKREADALFGELCGHFAEHGDLEEAAWRLAATFSPGEDFAPQRTRLDAWGAEIARRLAKAANDRDRIETLVEFLGHDVRLRGNEDDYYNINNSLLPEAIDTRLGIPITLSLIYIVVGRRAGLRIQGVGLPGHFIVRYRESFFDPFHGGRRVGLEECRALLEQQSLVLAAYHLEPVSARQMLLRMLTNIYALSEESDPPLAAKFSSWITALQRSVADERGA